MNKGGVPWTVLGEEFPSGYPGISQRSPQLEEQSLSNVPDDKQQTKMITASTPIPPGVLLSYPRQPCIEKAAKRRKMRRSPSEQSRTGSDVNNGRIWYRTWERRSCAEPAGTS